MAIPYRYVALVFFTGASIGGVAGLSKSPVGQTVLELITVFVVGAGGVYLLSNQRLARRTIFLRAVGSLGLGYLVAFWTALALASYYRAEASKPRSLGYAGATATSAHTLEVYELNAHLLAMGVPQVDAKNFVERLVVETDSADAHNSCKMEFQDKKELERELEKIESVYSAFSTCQERNSTKIVSENDMIAAEYIKKLVTELKKDLANKPDLKAPEFAKKQVNFIYDSEKILIDHPKLRTLPAACSPSDEVNLAAASLRGVFANCDPTPLGRAILQARVHSAAFAATWNAVSNRFTEVPTAEASPALVLEGWRP
jgi:hypothetical protein